MAQAPASSTARADLARPSRAPAPDGPRRGGGRRRTAARLVEALRGGPGGAVLLVAATVAALVWANLVIGLEVKRELVVGRLADRRRAAVPAVATLVGLLVPALVYVAFTAGTPAAGAWGVVISTDTAFVIGVLALLGSTCPPQLRVFLLALSIADDVGALTVIALFYTEDLALAPIAVAVGGLLLMLALRRLQVWRGPAYLVIAAVSWVALYLSGVHATLLGVVVALMTPAYLARRDEVG